MLYDAVKALAGMLSICAISSAAFSHASCSLDVVFVSFGNLTKQTLDMLL